ILLSPDGDFSLFAAPDADALLHRENEYLSVPDVAGAGALDDGVHGRLYEGVVDPYFQAHLLEKGARLLDAAVDFRDSFLASAPQHVGHGLEVYLLQVQLAHH